MPSLIMFEIKLQAMPVKYLNSFGYKHENDIMHYEYNLLNADLEDM